MTDMILTFSAIYLAIINIIAAAVVIYDKKISRLPRGSIRRIPEKRFVLFSILGGGLGTLFAMFTFHHKTKSHIGLVLKVATVTAVWYFAIIAVATKI